MDLVPLLAIKEIDLNTIIITIVGAVGAYYMAVIKKDVNSNTRAAAEREAVLRLRIDALDKTVQDLREERARGTATTTPATTVPAGAAMVDPETPLVVLDPTVGPDPNAKGK